MCPSSKSNILTAVVYQDRHVAGDHIVRVYVRDGEVAHLLGAGVVVHAGHIEGLSDRSGKPVASGEVTDRTAPASSSSAAAPRDLAPAAAMRRSPARAASVAASASSPTSPSPGTAMVAAVVTTTAASMAADAALAPAP